MIKAVVFDVDGTILDTEEAIFKGLDWVMRKYADRPAEREDMRAIFGMPGVDGLCKLGFSLEEAKKIHPKWSDISRDNRHLISLFPSMEETLKNLAGSSVKLGIVTSKTKYSLKNNFTPFLIDHYFEEIITADDTEKHKPDGEPLEECMRRLSVSPEETLYIGDSIFDNQCAHNAKAKFGLARWGSHTSSGFRADYIFRHPSDIEKAVFTSALLNE